MKKVITSACPKCHKYYTDDFDLQKFERVLAERLMFKRLIGVQCPQCKRWLLGHIEDQK